MILGRLGRMAYINTLPVDWGFVAGELGKLVEIQRGTPTALNRMLAEGQLDISPVSCVAAVEHAHEWLIVDQLCIGCHGAVGSVILQGDRPLEELHGARVAVTNASATAVQLLKILLHAHWQVHVEFVPQEEAAEARLLIGDAALRVSQTREASYVYDLGSAWQDYTGKSFVFGLWCVRQAFVEKHPAEALAIGCLLKLSHAIGRSSLDDVIREAARTVGLPRGTIRRYFGQLVHDLDDRLWSGLKHFLMLLGYDSRELKIFDIGNKKSKLITGVSSLEYERISSQIEAVVGHPLEERAEIWFGGR